MDRIKKIKIKQQDGTMSDYYPIGADAQNIDFANGYSLDQIIGNINPDEDGTLEVQLSKAIKYYNTIADMKADTKLAIGDVVETLGYNTKKDKHSGKYEITNISDNDREQILLNNGLYATLIAKDLCTRVKKIQTPIYGSLYMYNNQTEQVIKERINNLYNANCNGVILIAHIVDNSVKEGVNNLNYAKNYARSLNLECDTIKFHCNLNDVSHDTYKSIIINALSSITDLQTVYLYNEADAFMDENTVAVNSFVTQIKNLGYKVGISFDSGGIIRIKNKESYQTLYNNLDIIGYNLYVPIHSPGIKANTYHSVEEWETQLKNFVDNFPDKEIVITETGVIPYMEALENPSLYDISFFPTSHRSDDTFKIYFYGLFNNLNLNTVSKIYLWYIEGYTEECWNFIRNYLEEGV